MSSTLRASWRRDMVPPGCDRVAGTTWPGSGAAELGGGLHGCGGPAAQPRHDLGDGLCCVAERRSAVPEPRGPAALLGDAEELGVVLLGKRDGDDRVHGYSCGC